MKSNRTGERDQRSAAADGEKESCLSPPLLLTPPRRINRRAVNGNHARKSSSLLLVYFVPLTGTAYVLQRLQQVERSRVEGHVSGAYCVWTEYFFDNDFG